MTQPRNNRAELRAASCEDDVVPSKLEARRSPLVLATIPIMNPIRPLPASRAGIPVSRSILVSAMIGFQSHFLRNTASIMRAMSGMPRSRASIARAASSPLPYSTPDGHTGSQPRQPRQASRCWATASSPGWKMAAERPRMRTMRPRGESASSAVAR